MTTKLTEAEREALDAITEYWLLRPEPLFELVESIVDTRLAPIQALAEEWRAQPPALVHESLGSEYVGEYYITALGTALAAAVAHAERGEPS